MSTSFSRLHCPPELTMSLDMQALVNFGSTCQGLKAHIIDDNTLWKELCLRDFGCEFSGEKATFFEIYKRSHSNLKEGRFVIRDATNFLECPLRSWFSPYLGRSWLTCNNGRFGFSSGKQEIRLFDNKTETDIRISQENGFVSVHAIIYGERVYSSNTNGTVTIHDLKTGNLLKTIRNEHSGVLHCLVASKGVLFGRREPFYDKKWQEIEVWNTETEILLNCLPGHKCFVYSLVVLEKQEEETKLISSGGDQTIKIWTLSTGVCDEISTIDADVQILSLDKEKLCGLLTTGMIKTWNVETKECLWTIHCSKLQRSIISLTIAYGKLFSIGYYPNCPESLEVHDIKLGNLIASMELPAGLHATTPLCVTQQKIFFPCVSDYTLRCIDFTKDHETIFLNTAKEIRETGNCARFHAMPQDAKDQIYKESYLILAQKESFTEAQDYWGCGDHFFNNLNGFTSTPEEKAEAIENYVRKKNQVRTNDSIS